MTYKFPYSKKLPLQLFQRTRPVRVFLCPEFFNPNHGPLEGCLVTQVALIFWNPEI